MANQQNRTQLSKTKKILLWVASIIGLVAALLFSIPVVQSFTLRMSLESESKQTLSKTKSQLQNSLNERVNAMALQLGAAPSATYAATYNSCYTDHSDSGWFANNYNYNCILTKFAFFEVKNPSALLETVNATAKPASVERHAIDNDYYGNIYILSVDSNIVGSNINDLPYNLYIVKENTYSNVKKVLAIPAVSSNDRVVSYASEQEIANRAILEKSGSHSLDTKNTYIIFQSSEHYFQKDIGCRMPSLIFCESPI